MDAREQRGLVIAATQNITAGNNGWLVPSQSGHGKYTVRIADPKSPRCSCPDHEAGFKCKHIFAVEFMFTRVRQEENVDGSVTTITESVTVKTTAERRTYPQPWAQYNAAQVNERQHFHDLLADLCRLLPETPRKPGRGRRRRVRKGVSHVLPATRRLPGPLPSPQQRGKHRLNGEAEVRRFRQVEERHRAEERSLRQVRLPQRLLPDCRDVRDGHRPELQQPVKGTDGDSTIPDRGLIRPALPYNSPIGTAGVINRLGLPSSCGGSPAMKAGLPDREQTMCKCADCGFLAVREFQSKQLVEVEIDIRRTWKIPQNFDYQHKRYLEIPICFARAVRLDTEIGKNESEVRVSDILAVINKERECSGFAEWQHGFTPKEHQQMILSERMLENQIKLQAELVERDRAFQEDLRKKNVAFQEEQRQNDVEFRLEQERKDREYQERRDQEQREWQQRQERIADERREKHEKELHQQNAAREWNLAYLASAIAVLAAIIGLIAALK